MGLRGLGELERAIMEVVWSAHRPVTGRIVVDELARVRPIAYTTVTTVMDRLVRKGLLVKQPVGRAHTYQAVQTREAYTAGLMAGLLGNAGDTSAVLLHFVDQLAAGDAEHLRAALKAARDRPSRSTRR